MHGRFHAIWLLFTTGSKNGDSVYNFTEWLFGCLKLGTPGPESHGLGFGNNGSLLRTGHFVCTGSTAGIQLLTQGVSLHGCSQGRSRKQRWWEYKSLPHLVEGGKGCRSNWRALPWCSWLFSEIFLTCCEPHSDSAPASHRAAGSGAWSHPALCLSAGCWMHTNTKGDFDSRHQI